MLTAVQGIFDKHGYPDQLHQRRDLKYVDHAEKMLEIYRGGVGKTRQELHSQIEAIFFEEANCPQRRVDAFCKLLDDAAKYDEDSRGKAAALRIQVYDLARGKHPLVTAKDGLFDHTEESTKAEIAQALGRSWEDVDQSLFTDVIDYHRLKSFAGYTSAQAFLNRYNVAQWQARLYRAVRLTVHARKDLPTILRYAKLARLLHRIEKHPSSGGYVLIFDGPASVLRESRRYGVHMAQFLPALLACEDWTMQAEIQRSRGHFTTRVELSSGRLKSDLPSPEQFDSQVEERFFKKWAGRRHDGWTLARTDTILSHGQKAFVPDFTLKHDSSVEVCLEIVGYWTPEYLRAKVDTLRTFPNTRFLLAVVEQIEDDFPKDIAPIVWFKSGLKLKDVLAALPQFLGPCTPELETDHPKCRRTS